MKLFACNNILNDHHMLDLVWSLKALIVNLALRTQCTQICYRISGQFIQTKFILANLSRIFCNIKQLVNWQFGILFVQFNAIKSKCEEVN